MFFQNAVPCSCEELQLVVDFLFCALLKLIFFRWGFAYRLIYPPIYGSQTSEESSYRNLGFMLHMFEARILMDTLEWNLISPVTYTVRSKSFRTDFFLKIEDTWRRHIAFFIQNKLHWHIYRLLRGRTVPEKLPKIPLFWTFFNSSITASWISATSTKWNPFNFIFNLGNRKYFGGDKSGEDGGW